MRHGTRWGLDQREPRRACDVAIHEREVEVRICPHGSALGQRFQQLMRSPVCGAAFGGEVDERVVLVCRGSLDGDALVAAARVLWIDIAVVQIEGVHTYEANDCVATCAEYLEDGRVG